MFEPGGSMVWELLAGKVDVLFSLVVVSWTQRTHEMFDPTPGQFDGVEVG